LVEKLVTAWKNRNNPQSQKAQGSEVQDPRNRAPKESTQELLNLNLAKATNSKQVHPNLAGLDKLDKYLQKAPTNQRQHYNDFDYDDEQEFEHHGGDYDHDQLEIDDIEHGDYLEEQEYFQASKGQANRRQPIKYGGFMKGADQGNTDDLDFILDDPHNAGSLSDGY